MKMGKFLKLMSLSVLLSCGVDSETLPEDIFIKYFGGDGDFELNDMIFQDENESGLVLFGVRDGEVLDANEISFFEKNLYLVSVGLDGSIQNEVMLELNDGLGTVFHFDEEAGRISRTSDGGYLLIGTVLDFDYNGLQPNQVNYIVWTKVDASLNQVDIWHIEGNGVGNYHGVDITEMADGGILISGYTDINGSNDFYYKKIGGTNPEWERIQTRMGSNDKLIRTLPVNSGNYVLFGETEALSGDGETGINVERTIIDPDGIIQNSLIYGIVNDGGVRDDIPEDVLERPGGFVIVGTSKLNELTYEPFIMLVDIPGAKTNEVLYDLEFTGSAEINSSGEGLGVVQLYNNNYFVIGSIVDYQSVNENRGSEGFIMPTDQDGVKNDALGIYGLVNGDDNMVRALTSMNGTVYIGGNFDFGGGLTQMVLMRVNPNGVLKK